MSLNFKLSKVIYFLLFILQLFFLTFTLLSVSWFEYSSLKYDLDTFTYERLLNVGAYEDSIKNLSFINLFNLEPSWSFILVVLDHFFDSEDVVFFIIPFLILISYAFYLYLNSSNLVVLFLIHPIATMFYLNQLRLAFAMSIFLLIYSLFKERKFIYFFSFPLFTIHSSFLIFWLIFLFVEILLDSQKSNLYKLLVVIISSFFFAFLTGPALSIILSFVGDRRADDYVDGVWQTSVLTSIYCLIFILIFLMNFYTNKIKKINFEQLITIFFLGMVFISPIFVGGYPFRFLSAIFPIMLIAFYKLDRQYSIFAYSFLLLIGLYIGLFQLNWIRLLG